MTAQSVFHLPVHPTMRHPRTGEPLRAVGFVGGRPVWPIMGASPDDPGNGGQSGDGSGASGGGSGSGSSGQGASGSGSGSGSDGGGTGRGSATDAQGNDLGYPKDTPVTEMSDKEQAAYWKHNSRRHEGRYKDLVGDRKPEDVKNDLTAYAELQRQQQTPAEQALSQRYDEGKADGVKSERKNTATVLFRGALEQAGIEGDDLDELVSGFNVDAFITDDGVDTTKLTAFARRFTTAGTADGSGDRRQRDFGAGRRRDSQDRERGAGGKAEAQRRFQKNKQTTDA